MEDLRIKRTKLAIKRALLELVEKVGFDKVRVSDITKVANVNRNTFYLHYESKEDLVKQIAMEIIDSKIVSIDYGSPFKAKTKKRISEIFTLLLNSMEENIDIYRIFLLNPAMEGYLTLTINDFKQKAFQYVKKTPLSELQLEYLSGGIIGVLSKWIVYATGSKEETIKVLTEMSYASGRIIYMDSIKR